MQILAKAGYKGDYSFEWEKRWHPEIPEPEVAFPHYARVVRGISVRQAEGGERGALLRPGSPQLVEVFANLLQVLSFALLRTRRNRSRVERQDVAAQRASTLEIVVGELVEQAGYASSASR